jgi:hypothetical protein
MTSSESGPSSSEPESPVRPEHIDFVKRRTQAGVYRVFEVKTTYVINFITRKGDFVVACCAPVPTNREGSSEKYLALEMAKDCMLYDHISVYYSLPFRSCSSKK